MSSVLMEENKIRRISAFNNCIQVILNTVLYHSESVQVLFILKELHILYQIGIF